MADVTIDYDRVNAVSAELNAAVSYTLPELTSLRTAVSHLLTGKGGLWLKKSSDVIDGQYNDFHSSVTSAVNNITSFAQQFTNIVNQLQAMDEAISKPS